MFKVVNIPEALDILSNIIYNQGQSLSWCRNTWLIVNDFCQNHMREVKENISYFLIITSNLSRGEHF